MTKLDACDRDDACVSCGVKLRPVGEGAYCGRCADDIKAEAETVDAFDTLAKSYGYRPSERTNPANYYAHPTLMHEIEVERNADLAKQFWRWRPGVGTDERPRSGMSIEGLRAVLQRVHGRTT